MSLMHSHPTPPSDANPDAYAYFSVGPPVDNRYQCYCAHPYTEPASSESEDSDGDNPATFTLRCTNSFTQADYAAGWTLCTHCRPSPALLYGRACQVARLATECMEQNGFPTHRCSPINGYYVEETQLNPRLRGVLCRCPCQTCDIQGNERRVVHDFTDTARRIAQEDVHALLAGTKPAPGPHRPIRPWQTRHAISNEGHNEFD